MILLRQNIVKSNFSECLFVACKFQDVQIFGSIIARSIFSRALIQRCSVIGSNFTESNFDSATLIDSEFKSVDCNRSRWVDAQLTRVSLEECEINATDFSNAKLQDCKFPGCSLVGSNWHNIDVDLFLSESQRSKILPVDKERLIADSVFFEPQAFRSAVG